MENETMGSTESSADSEHILFPAIADMSVEELRHTILRVVDQLRRFQAQVIETSARFEGALGLVAELRAEKAELEQRLAELGDDER